MPLLTDEVTNSKAHPQHPIKLALVNQPFECDGCKDIGIGFCYECQAKGCGYIFHEECARPQEITSHPFSKGCHFTFERPSRNSNAQVYRICDACGTHASGFFHVCYKHGTNGHFIHPSCMKLKHEMKLDGVDLVLSGNVPKRCNLCGHKHAFDGVKGWSYATTDHGGLCLHIKCVKEMILDGWKRKYLMPTLTGSSSSSTPLAISMESTTTTTTAEFIAQEPSGRTFIGINNAGNGAIVVHRQKKNPVKVQFDKIKRLVKLAYAAIAFSLFGSPTVAPQARDIMEALANH